MRTLVQNLRPGDEITVPSQLLSNRAVIKSIAPYHAKNGFFYVMKLETRDGPWAGSAMIGFEADEKLHYRRPRNWWRNLLKSVDLIGLFDHE